MKINWYLLIFLLSLSLGFLSIQKAARITHLPDYFPKMIVPAGNEMNKTRIQLGKLLFFDKRLSIDESISCSSCHKPELAFADNLPVTPGVEGRLGNRNAPTLTNVGYNPVYLFDGFLETLEKQAVVPIEEHAEMAFNIVEITKRFASNKQYQKLAQKAYNRNLDPFVITRALATFQRSLISYQSKYDQVLLGKDKFSETEKKGMDLFFNQLKCTECHAGFNFTNFSTQNNGLYENYIDSGRMRVTKNEMDRDLFKVPTLRNVALTAPYMHDGSISTLEDVIKHYEKGGLPNKNKSIHVQPFIISNEDRDNLIQFLNTLTDDKFVKRHSN
ncbi:MAG: cytochrome c peroxidase [Crocinitomicaceae bacterium]